MPSLLQSFDSAQQYVSKYKGYLDDNSDRPRQPKINAGLRNLICFTQGVVIDILKEVCLSFYYPY